MPSNRSALLSAGLAAALLCMSPAQAQDISPLSVDGSRPTSMTVRVAGLDYPQVRTEVRKAARLVCRNAMRNGELYAFDLRWCADRASGGALDQYRSAMRSGGEVRTSALTIGIAAGS